MKVTAILARLGALYLLDSTLNLQQQLCDWQMHLSGMDL